MKINIPTVSVIIPCFNAERWIRETLQSVIGQGLNDIEIIVVDDGSTDSSARIVEDGFPSARLVKTGNQGASKARNIGTDSSSGEFIQYLDADDLLAPDKLKLQLGALKTSGADIAYGDWQKLVETGDGKFIKDGIVSRRIEDPEIELFTTDKWCPMAAYLFRRSIVGKAGGWNERLPVIQDVRFQIDCALSGARFVYCPGIMGYFRVQHKDSLSTRDPISFARDCLLNTNEVEEWWIEHGGIDAKRKAALIRAYEHVARSSFEKDAPTFNSAHNALRRLQPGYTPESSRRLWLASRLLGYRNAEKAALLYRNAKKLFKQNQNKII